MTRRLSAFLATLVCAATAAAAQDAPRPPAAASEAPPAEEDVVKREEVVVVSASKVESTLVNAPATMSVVTPEVLRNSPAQNYGDLLRAVPGVNVIQMSARDINLTSRQATSTLATSQLTLLDGRSIYLDFFGLVLWDLVPSNMNEIKQIEVVRGPASAVWGANALTGVVNIITRSPREIAKDGYGSLILNAGRFDRSVGSRSNDGDGNSYGGSFTFAQAPNERFAYKLSGGYYFSDPFSRPVGNVPRVADPRVPGAVCSASSTAGCIGGAPYPADRSGTGAFQNSRTRQPRGDLRVDQDFASGARLTYSAGIAGTEGIVHTGIGPFDLQEGSKMYYGRVGFSNGAFKAAAFGNFLRAEAPNLLLRDPATLAPVRLDFRTETFDLELGHFKALGVGKRVQHVLSYGGNARRNNFEITLAPNAENRNEFGAYLQDEIFFDKFRFTIGGRVDKFGNIEDPVFSPRITAMFKPANQHALRLSFNRAFRSPSAVNNYLSQDIFSPTLVDLRQLLGALDRFGVPVPTAVRAGMATPFFLRVRNVGNRVGGTPLKEESLDAYEIAYTGTFKNTTVGLAFYQNDQNDNINFTQVTPSASNRNGLPPFDTYTAANVPQLVGINAINQPVSGTLIPYLLGLPAVFGGPIRLPRTVSTYLNLGPTRQRGVEVSLNQNFDDRLTGYANYSFQDDPKILAADAGQIEYPSEELALPAKHRFNAGLNYASKRVVAQGSVHHTSRALWSDVLSREFHGFTEDYTMVNATLGVRWLDGKLTTSIKGTNIFNADVQQHVFGDILKRTLYGEVKVDF